MDYGFISFFVKAIENLRFSMDYNELIIIFCKNYIFSGYGYEFYFVRLVRFFPSKSTFLKKYLLIF